MRRSLLCVILLVFGFAAMGCTGNPPIPCFNDNDSICEQAGRLPPLAGADLVCNMAYTVEMACQEYLAMLPPQAPVPDICANIPIDAGTCQPPGTEGSPCAQDANCLSGECDLDQGECL